MSASLNLHIEIGLPVVVLMVVEGDGCDPRLLEVLQVSKALLQRLVISSPNSNKSSLVMRFLELLVVI